jgi:hypothetical protein
MPKFPLILISLKIGDDEWGLLTACNSIAIGTTRRVNYSIEQRRSKGRVLGGGMVVDVTTVLDNTRVSLYVQGVVDLLLRTWYQRLKWECKTLKKIDTTIPMSSRQSELPGQRGGARSTTTQTSSSCCCRSCTVTRSGRSAARSASTWVSDDDEQRTPAWHLSRSPQHCSPAGFRFHIPHKLYYLSRAHQLK